MQSIKYNILLNGISLSAPNNTIKASELIYIELKTSNPLPKGSPCNKNLNRSLEVQGLNWFHFVEIKNGTGSDN